jgi:hypothetical protein
MLLKGALSELLKSPANAAYTFRISINAKNLAEAEDEITERKYSLECAARDRRLPD